MNIVNAGNTYQIYGNELKTFKTLPVASYEVNFNKMQGFFLTQRNDLTVNEEKVYGNHNEKINKVLNTFSHVDRNLGVILSGEKGIGKSLFARMLAAEGVKRNIPLILVTGFVPGIDNFISSIEQEVIVLFDEFEKTFRETEESSPQESMLSLFDGIDGGKKLYVITCNKASDLNEYLLNRPGRFHYHFILDVPTGLEIKEYMTDKLKPEYHDVIESVVKWGVLNSATYDQLRAIVFELNMGYSLQETLLDLNIEKGGASPFYFTAQFANGKVSGEEYERVSIHSTHPHSVWFNEHVGIRFIPSNIYYDMDREKYMLDMKNVIIQWDSDIRYADEDDEFAKKAKIDNEIVKIHIRKADTSNRKYMLV